MHADLIPKYQLELESFTNSLRELQGRFLVRQEVPATTSQKMLGIAPKGSGLGTDSQAFRDWYYREVFGRSGAFQIGRCEVLEKHRCARAYLITHAPEVEKILKVAGLGTDTLLLFLQALEHDIRDVGRYTQLLRLRLSQIPSNTVSIPSPSSFPEELKPKLSTQQKIILRIYHENDTSIENLLAVNVGQGTMGLIDFLHRRGFPRSTENSVRPALRKLERLGYLSAAEKGPGGGRYITPNGRERAQCIIESA
jgi:hypothetical protein